MVQLAWCSMNLKDIELEIKKEIEFFLDSTDQSVEMVSLVDLELFYDKNIYWEKEDEEYYSKE